MPGRPRLRADISVIPVRTKPGSIAKTSTPLPTSVSARHSVKQRRPALDWRRRFGKISSRLHHQAAGPVLGCRSAARSSTGTADACGRALMTRWAPSSNSRCPPSQTLRRASEPVVGSHDPRDRIPSPATASDSSPPTPAIVLRLIAPHPIEGQAVPSVNIRRTHAMLN